MTLNFNTYLMSIWAIVFLCFINFRLLFYSFKRFKRLLNDSENRHAIRIFKIKWSFILFSDLVVFMILLGLLLIINTSFVTEIISLLVALIYLAFIVNMMRKKTAVFFDKNRIVNNIDEIRKTVEENDAIDSNAYEQLNDGTGARRLIIKRKKTLYASLLKIYVFFEAENIEDNCFEISIDGYQFRQVGRLTNGRTLSIDLPTRSVNMLLCTNKLLTFHRIPINIKRFTVLSGNNDVVLHVETVPNNPARVPPGVAYLIEKGTMIK